MQNLTGRFVVAATLVAAAGTAWSAEYPRLSPRGTASQIVGYTEVAIAYGRPAVRGRQIWGTLVPYDKLWRTGADEATAIAFTTDVTIDGKKLPAGLYSLFMIPGKNEWTIIFNKEAKQFGGFQYKESQDALRLKVKPEPAEFHERMTFDFPVVAVDSAEVALFWEKLKVGFTFKTDAVEKALAQARAAVAEAKADDFRTPQAAAVFCIENKLNLDEAGAWADKAVAAKETMSTLMARARVLAAQGKKTEAIMVATRAIEIGRQANPNANTAWVEAYMADWRR